MDKKKCRKDAVMKRAGKKYNDGSDFSDYEKEVARRQLADRGGRDFTRPGDESNYRKRKKTLKSLRDSTKGSFMDKLRNFMKSKKDK